MLAAANMTFTGLVARMPSAGSYRGNLDKLCVLQRPSCKPQTPVNILPEACHDEPYYSFTVKLAVFQSKLGAYAHWVLLYTHTLLSRMWAHLIRFYQYLNWTMPTVQQLLSSLGEGLYMRF